MACALDGTDDVDFDASAKVTELRREWERSRAFLEELEACFPSPASGAEQPAGLQPTTWAPIDADETPFATPEPTSCEDPVSTAPNSSTGARNAVRHRRGVRDASAASDAAEPRRTSVPQIHMKFEPSEELRSLEAAFGEDGSVLRSGLLQPRQPKPPPVLLRGGSVQRRGPPPVNRARLLRASTFDSNGSAAAANESPSAPGPIGELATQLSTPTTAAATATIAYAASTSASGAAGTAGTAGPTRALQFALSLSAGGVGAGAAVHTARRFSMDFEQRRSFGAAGSVGCGGSPALVPTVMGLGAQRRVSIGSPGWGGEAAAKVAGGVGGVGGTLSFRRMESGGGGGSGSGAGDATPSWAGSACGSGRNSFTNDEPGSVSGGGGAVAVGSPPAAARELPSLRLDRLSTSVNASDAAMRRAAAANVAITGGGGSGASTQPGCAHVDSPARPSAAAAYTPASFARFRACRSFPRTGHSDTGAGGGSPNGGSGGGGSPPGASDDGALDGAEPVSLATRASLPRAIGPQHPHLHRERQQQQQAQGQLWLVPGSPGSAGLGSPRGPAPGPGPASASASASSAPASFGSPLRYMRSLSMPRPHTSRWAEEQPHPLQPPQQQQRDAQQEDDEEDQQVQQAPEEEPAAFGSHYRPGRTASQGALRLRGIPETAIPESGAVPSFDRLSGGHGGGGGGDGGRFGWRVPCEVFGAGQVGARRSPRFSWGVETIGGGGGMGGTGGGTGGGGAAKGQE